MIEITFNKKSEYEGVVCLGFFDCVHIGHLELIKEAKKQGKKVFVFTFTNDISSYITNKRGYIYSYKERLSRFFEEGVDGVIGATFDQNFMNMTPTEFLLALENTLNIQGIVCGEDYTFGKCALGKTEDIKHFFNNKKVSVNVLKLVEYDEKKASTSLAKEYLEKGDIENLNALLKTPYRISGEIVKGLQNGTKLGFPTANISVLIGQTRIKEGVYGGYAYLDGKKYKAIINAGARPTYNSYEYKIESYIDGNFPPLYGKEITVEFSFKIRDIMKFDNVEKLKEQLKKDLTEIEKL